MRNPGTTRRLALALMTTAAISTGGALIAAPAANADAPTRDELLRICDFGVSDDGEYRHNSCAFEAVTESSSELEWHRVGEPVTNCSPGATQPVTSTIGAVRTDTETWTVGGTAGVTLGAVKVEGKSEYQTSRAITSERRDTVVAPPGRKNALTLGTGWVTQTGRLRVVTDFGTPGETTGPIQETFYVDDVTRRVPNGYTEKGQDEVSCAEKFRIDPEP